MATIKFIYRADKEDGSGEAPLYLRIYHERKKRHKKTDIYLKATHWDEDNQRIRKSHPKSTKLNLHLNKWKMRAREAVQNADPLTAENIKYYIEGKSARRYHEYVKEVLPAFSYSYRKLIKAANKHLKKFAPDLLLTDLNSSLIGRFHQHLIKSVSQNTANQYVGVIRRVLNQAIDDGLITSEDSPFAMRKISMSWEEVESTPLSLKQFKSVRDCDVPEDVQLFKDMFLFSIYMDGMRLSDVLTFRPDDFSRKNQYTMGKTKKKKQIKPTRAAKEIIDKYKGNTYLFPLLDPELEGEAMKEEIHRLRAVIWNKIKRLGKCAGLDVHLHFHMARNTSGYIAYKNGWSLMEIQQMYRHTSIQQTRDYLGKMAPEEIDSKRDELWD